MKIVLTDEAPVNQRARRFSIQEASEVHEEVKRLLHKGIIVPSNSEFASAVVPVRRKNGKLRLCVDYRKINH